MASKRLLDWTSLRLGWARRWIEPTVVADFAAAWLVHHPEHASRPWSILVVAAELERDQVASLLAEAASEHGGDGAQAKDRWELCFLLSIRESDGDWEAKVSALEDLMSELGYPKDMRLCWRYRASKEAIAAGLAEAQDTNIDPLDAMDTLIAQLERRV